MAMPPRRSRGLTYLGFLVLLAVMSGIVAAAIEAWQTRERRQKEVELLFIGSQFRQALARYYKASPGGSPRYPRELADLVEDQRHPAVRRHLRRIYADPMTGRTEWGLVRLQDGGIIGVHSLSELEPLKKTGFRPADAGLANKRRYSEWAFLYFGVESMAAGQNQGQGTLGRTRTPR